MPFLPVVRDQEWASLIEQNKKAKDRQRNYLRSTSKGLHANTSQQQTCQPDGKRFLIIITTDSAGQTFARYLVFVTYASDMTEGVCYPYFYKH